MNGSQKFIGLTKLIFAVGISTYMALFHSNMISSSGNFAIVTVVLMNTIFAFMALAMARDSVDCASGIARNWTELMSMHEEVNRRLSKSSMSLSILSITGGLAIVVWAFPAVQIVHMAFTGFAVFTTLMGIQISRMYIKCLREFYEMECEKCQPEILNNRKK